VIPFIARLALFVGLTAGSIIRVEPAIAAAVGAVLGLDRCAINGDAPPNTSYGGGMGLIAGVQGELALGENIALSLQPMFTQRSTALTAADSEEPTGERELELSLDYIAVPLVLKLSAAGGRTYVAGGMDIAFLTEARITGGGLDEDVTASFQDVDVGAVLGFGVVFPIGRPRITTELRYVQGLVNLAGDESGVIQDLPDRFHSSGWQLTAGILFPLGDR
jgi:Outer membrane protein beta-barrel domain